MNSMSSEIIKSRLNDHLPWMLYENNRIGERVEWACAYIPHPAIHYPPPKKNPILSELSYIELLSYYLFLLSIQILFSTG